MYTPHADRVSALLFHVKATAPKPKLNIGFRVEVLWQALTLPETNMETQKGPHKQSFKNGTIWVSMLVSRSVLIFWVWT